jgi:hypothetical protein
MQEHFFLNLFFVGILKVSDENRRIGICIRIRIHQLEAWIRGSGSTPKCHGSATLQKANDLFQKTMTTMETEYPMTRRMTMTMTNFNIKFLNVFYPSQFI